MLGLKLPTDPRWVNIAEKNIEEILIDHAYCEQKAASTAISFILSFPERTELVTAMVAMVKEEMSHFKMVHDKLIARGIPLGPNRSDKYVVELIKFFPKGGSKLSNLIHRLLYSALIEARSCERFRLLSENLADPELSKFYHDLMVSEANHYILFLTFARDFGVREEVDKLWDDLLVYEAEIMKKLANTESIHG
ncbi:tRNA-(ms[2]io[6]A)-hydroxylase [Flavicella sediminum]|uniref:tRNA-(ms[2]io[6]A)-hydroxylase n=1 Tax=Flavicella sediminum TaxID=2585141 RepID=UPI00111FCA7C|nr:tRNA-(ms[2]io[6]A)-hydroxylase [Flavicella sediminum]